MLILEGCDCGGKSTLAVRLAEQYDSPITHYSAHDPVAMLKKAQEGKTGTGEILDRFHLSEPPYSMYYRHEVPNYPSVDIIDNTLVLGNNLVILCIPPWNTVKQAWEERINQELIKNVQELHGIYMWYANKAGRYRTPTTHYNHVTDSLEKLFEFIDDFFSENSNGK